MGVPGAALANGLAFSLGALIFLARWRRGSLVLGSGPPDAFTRRRVRELFRIGYPAGLEQVVWQLGFLAFLWVVSLYGTAAYGLWYRAWHERGPYDPGGCGR